MATNYKSLQLLRNEVYFADKTAAINGITGSSTNVSDGSIKLARYYSDATSGTVRTIFGIYEGTKNSYTLYESAYNLTAATFNEVSGLILSDTDGIKLHFDVDGDDILVDSAYTTFHYNPEFSGSGVTEITSADTIASGITSLQKTINQLATDFIEHEKIDDKEIELLRVNCGFDSGFTYHPGSATTVISSSTNVSESLDMLDAAIKDVKVYKTVKLTDAELAALAEENVREAYKTISIKDPDKATSAVTQEGDTIKVYKDNALSSVTLTHSGNSEYMHFVYINASGETQTIDVDITKFLSEAEFKDGLELSTDPGDSGYTVHVKLDKTPGSDSEKFLYMRSGATADENGSVALSGISEAIASAKTVVSGLAGVIVESSITVDSATCYSLSADAETIKVVKDIVSGTSATDVPFIASGVSVNDALQSIVDELINDELVTEKAFEQLQKYLGFNDYLEYHPGSGDTIISGASGVTEALDLIDKAIKYVNVYSGNTGIKTEQVDDPVSGGTYVYLNLAPADETNANDMLTLQPSGLTLSDTWDCGEY